ncbi:MAG: S-adenosylmethionine decarboxylase [Oscillospiraceae bacterium]|nr:S-adenosylmethionine decarboxylase [Oscillospiraceae bacterium]
MRATRHFMLDAYDCNFEQANSFMVVNTLLVTLANELEMNPIMPPFVLPYYYCDETEDGGISAFVLCENGSHITVHTFPYRYCYFIDILTDKFFEEERAKELILRQIYAKKMNVLVTDRRYDSLKESVINSSTDFGPHYMITIENLDASMESIYSWLDSVAPKINMLPISRPYVIFDRIEDHDYISGVLVVAQSHIAFHYSTKERCAHVDIFSCSFLDDGVVENILEQSFGQDVKIQLFARGSKHKHNIQYTEKHNDNVRMNKSWRTSIM